MRQIPTESSQFCRLYVFERRDIDMMMIVKYVRPARKRMSVINNTMFDDRYYT